MPIKIMVKVKFCGLSRIEDIEAANELMPEYIGFVFWDKSKRYISAEKGLELRKHLAPGIKAVGVFLDEPYENVAAILNSGVIDIAQLHGHEDEKYIEKLRRLSNKPIIKAFNITGDITDSSICNNAKLSEIQLANSSPADFILLDSKTAGSGNTFNWDFTKGITRPYFLAGGLNPENASEAVKLKPYAVDVSSGIETDGVKDINKMKKFIEIVRGGNDVG